MRWSKKIRHIWHELYYTHASKARVDYALRCQEFVHQLETPEKNLSLKSRFRFHLHLSLCQACHNYFKFSQIVRKVLKKKKYESLSPEDLKKFNDRLLKIHKSQ